MLIGLGGRKRSGKDTAGAYLIKEHGFERVAFAHPLKKAIANLFDIPYNAIEKYKDDPRVRIMFGIMHNGGDWEPMRTLVLTEFIKHFGTEAIRDVLGDDIWMDRVLPLDGFYEGRNIVVTDVRFPNEAKRVKELGGVVVKINRVTALRSQDPHRSEALMFEADYHIENNGTVEELYDQLEHILVSTAKS